MYCLKCRKDTKDLNVKAFMTKNNRCMLKSNCNICNGKKAKFISKKEIIGIRLPFKNIWSNYFKNTHFK